MLRFSRCFLSVVALCLAGCAADRPYRNVIDAALPRPTACLPGDGEALPSFEVCAYATKDEPKGEYFVGYVEFDDQGWFQDKRQKDALFRQLRQYHEQTQEQFLIVTFAHGWKHNAGADDENVKEFHQLLQELDLHERVARENAPGTKPRKVVGVYLGWRGHSLTVPLLDNLTFWTRKNAAERVGLRSAKQLVMELNQFRSYANHWAFSDRIAGPDETQLVFLGHSFGGQILYHALHTELMDRALSIKPDRSYRTAKSFGDFIFLVNPAFEGAAYEPLWLAGNSRCYGDKQRPILAVVTSDADYATRYAFPLGRLYTFAQSAPHDGERETVLNTVGHLARYRTHSLHAKDQPANGEASLVAEKSMASARATQRQLSGKPLAPTRNEQEVVFSTGVLKWLNNPKDVDDFPYLAISTDRQMIKDHGDIWNPRFREFMAEFITRQVMEPPPTEGRVASCKAFD